MPISDQKTRARLSFLESEAREHPRRHRLRLLGIALLGYAYPFSLLLICLAVVIAMTAGISSVMKSDIIQLMVVYLFFLVAALIWSAIILRTFFVRLPEPANPMLLAADAPALRAMIEDIRRTLGSPTIHRISIDWHLNASVAQRARFGLVGPKTNYLSIGLPLLLATTPDEFRVILAHELGHLRGNHNRFSAWIYRIGQTWQEFAGQNAGKGRLRRFIMDWFAKRYGRYLWISSLALRRLHEYEADRRGGEASSPRQAAQVLILLDWIGYLMDRSFWPTLRREAGAEPLPPSDMLSRLSQFLTGEIDPQQLQRWRRREQRARTPITSDHPCLMDRLESLNCRNLLDQYQSSPIGNIESSAASLLGDCRTHAWQIANASWKASIIQNWRREHAAAKVLREKPEKSGVPDPDSDWAAVQNSALDAAPQQARQILHDFLSTHPDHAAANYLLGESLLRDDDDSAVAYFEKAMRDTDFLAPSLHLLLNYYRETGRDADADPIRQRLEDYERDLIVARKERLTVSRRDRFAPHDLTDDQLNQIRRTLHLYPQVRSAHLAKKQLRVFTDKPSYVLAVRRRWTPFEDTRRTDKFLSACLASQMPVPCAVMIVRWRNNRIFKRMLPLCGMPIYDGGSSTA